MSKPANQPPRKTVGPDGATLTGPVTLTGVVRTSKGYAVARAVVSPDGTAAITLGVSQVYREHVAHEHSRMLPGLANSA